MAIERGTTLLSAYFPSFTNDVLGVYDSNFNQVFKNARAIKAYIKPSSKIMDHPLEDGSVISDHSIFNPIEIEILLILSKNDYRDTYEEIENIYEGRELLTVKTFSSSYSSQMILDISHEEGREMYGALSMTMKLRQVQFVKPEFSTIPKNINNSKTVDKGTQIPKSTTNGSAATVGLDYIKNKFK